MNRRSFLRTLTILSASGSSVVLLNRAIAVSPVSTENPESLLEILIRSQVMCDSLLQHRIILTPSTSVSVTSAMQELSALIQQARLRIHSGNDHSAAFWQSCADAFVRTADQLASLNSTRQPGSTSAEAARELFEHAGDRLRQKTLAAVEMIRS